MFIQTEATPNPETLKFIIGDVINNAEPREFVANDDNIQDISPLAAKIFTIDGVVRIFIAKDFVSVTKNNDFEWYQLKPSVLSVIMQHQESGDAVIEAQNIHDDNAINDIEYTPEEQKIVDNIKELLEERVRPFVEQDGGSIVFQGFDKGIVYLAMRGACAGCPSSSATLKMGIERMLTHYIPEVHEVRAAL